MNDVLLDGAGYSIGDAALALLITLSALLTYARIGFERSPLRMPWARMLMGVGFTVWSMRFWYAIATGLDVIVAPVSLIAIGMVTSGYCIVQLRIVRRLSALSKHPLYCLREPSHPCQREDRVQQVILRGFE